MTARLQGTRWIEDRRSLRYDIWVGNTQVASPWYYRPECMDLWDKALGRPMVSLHGLAAGEVAEEIGLAAALLAANPQTMTELTAARALGRMHHLCVVSARWTARVETVPVVSYFELVEAVLSKSITGEQALKVARERGGSEADTRKMLNWAHQALLAESRETASARRRGRRGGA